MSIKWFKGPSGEAFPVLCGPDGINIPSIADKLKLKPRPLELNGLLVDFNSATGYLSLTGTEGFLDGLGDSPRSAIPVSGQSAGAAGQEWFRGELQTLWDQVAAEKRAREEVEQKLDLLQSEEDPEWDKHVELSQQFASRLNLSDNSHHVAP